MSALIALLNKQGAVVASDKASSGGKNGTQIKKSQKIYAHKFLPITFLTHDREDVSRISSFYLIQKYLSITKKKLPKLEDYAVGFIDFLNDNPIFTYEAQVSQFGVNWESFFEQVYFDTRDSFEKSDDEYIASKYGDPEHRSTFFKFAEKSLGDLVDDWRKRGKNIDFPSRDTINNFFDANKHIIHSVATKRSMAGFYDAKRRELIEELAWLIHVKYQSSVYTRVALVGYGENEDMPSFVEIHIQGVYNNKLCYKILRKGKISPAVQESIFATFAIAKSDDSRHFFSSTTVEELFAARRILQDAKFTIIQKLSEEADKREDRKILLAGIGDFLLNLINDELNKAYDQILEKGEKVLKEPLEYILPAAEVEELAELAESILNIVWSRIMMTGSPFFVSKNIDMISIDKFEGAKWVMKDGKKIIE